MLLLGSWRSKKESSQGVGIQPSGERLISTYREGVTQFICLEPSSIKGVGCQSSCPIFEGVHVSVVILKFLFIMFIWREELFILSILATPILLVIHQLERRLYILCQLLNLSKLFRLRRCALTTGEVQVQGPFKFVACSLLCSPFIEG